MKPTPTHRRSPSVVPPAAGRVAFDAIAALGAGAAFDAVALAARLGPGDRALLEAALFDGATCRDLAGALGREVAKVRGRLGAAMHALHRVLIGEPAGGAVATVLALHALGALDPDEAALVDAMLTHQPALRGIHAGHCALVGELCLMVVPVAPPPCLMLPYESDGAAAR